MYLFNYDRTSLINTDNVLSYGFHRVDIDSYESDSKLIRIAVMNPKYERLFDLPDDGTIDPRDFLIKLAREISDPKNKDKIAELHPHRVKDTLYLLSIY